MRARGNAPSGVLARVSRLPADHFTLHLGSCARATFALTPPASWRFVVPRRCNCLRLTTGSKLSEQVRACHIFALPASIIPKTFLAPVNEKLEVMAYMPIIDITIVGKAYLPEVGGGPIIPPGQPPGIWPPPGVVTPPIYYPPAQPPGIWPPPGVVTPPIFYPPEIWPTPPAKPPLGIWGGGPLPVPAPPIYYPPLGIWGGPIIPPPQPGVPAHPIVIPLPPDSDLKPEHPIVLPPGTVPGVPAHPIVIVPPAPPEGGSKPPPPEGGWGYSPEYGWGYFPPSSDKPNPAPIPDVPHVEPH